ncbi:MAG: DUF3380 domain-containing protein [Ramlibacter sp.]|nr:DUF3380 domain-containing protein [Ramlibacter sp.]
MTGKELQEWLNAHGASLIVDGDPGGLTRDAIRKVFTNACADAVTDDDIAHLASRLGCSPKQLRAVSDVESGKSGFDNMGHPKILFERHIFARLTKGKWSPAIFSNRSGGGYSESSWDKLAAAACKDAAAAFSAVSWGKFQVLGMHWSFLGYPSPIDMAYSTVTSEAAHYEMLARYIEKNGMKSKLSDISTNPEDNRRFARSYNGAAYTQFNYHIKLADAMR